MLLVNKITAIHVYVVSIFVSSQKSATYQPVYCQCITYICPYFYSIVEISSILACTICVLHKNHDNTWFTRFPLYIYVWSIFCLLYKSAAYQLVLFVFPIKMSLFMLRQVVILASCSCYYRLCYVLVCYCLHNIGSFITFFSFYH